MAQPTIKKVTARGKVRYQFVVDIGPDPKTGKRRQLTRTFDKKTGPGGAQEALSKILNEVNRGVFAAPSKQTVGEYLDEWLRSATRGKEKHTVANYGYALQPVREQYGAKPLQKLSTKDVEDLVDWMLESGRKRGGKAGTGLGPRAVQLTLGRLRAALDSAVNRRYVEFNVAAPVKCPAQAKTKRVPWSEIEVKAFLAALAGARLRGVMLLSLMGLRPAEVCGLRWKEDVDLVAETLAVGSNTRTVVWGPDGGYVEEKGAKSDAGERPLPLPGPVSAALLEFQRRQAEEKRLAGADYVDSGYVLVDEIGEPCKTDWLRRRAYKLMDEAGVRRTRLYDARHACLTYLATNGVPDVIVSAWAGHSDLSLAKKVYVHPSAEDLKQGSEALTKLFS